MCSTLWVKHLFLMSSPSSQLLPAALHPLLALLVLLIAEIKFVRLQFQKAILVVLFSSSCFVCPLLSKNEEVWLLLISKILAAKMSRSSSQPVHLSSPFPQQKGSAEPLNSQSKQLRERIVAAPGFRLIVFLMPLLLYMVNFRREVLLQILSCLCL